MDWQKVFEGLRLLVTGVIERLGPVARILHMVWPYVWRLWNVIARFSTSVYELFYAIYAALMAMLKPVYKLVRANRLSSITIGGGSLLIAALLLSIEERNLPQPDPEFDERPEYVVGAVISLSGKFAKRGGEMLLGYKTAASLINEAGGIRIDGMPHNLALEVYDDESNILRVPDVTRKLLSKNSPEVLLGPYSSLLARPMISEAVRAEVPVVVPIASSAGLSDLPANSAFLLQTPPRRHLQLAANNLLAHFAQKRNSVLDEKAKKKKGIFASGDKPTVLVSAAADQHSKEVIAGVLEVLAMDEAIEIEQIDLAVSEEGQLEELHKKLASADAVFISGFADGATKLMETIATEGITIPFIAMTHCDIANIGTQEPTAAQGALCAVHWQPEASFKGTEPISDEEFDHRYFEDHATLPTHRSAAAAAAVQLIASAVTRMQNDVKLTMSGALATSRIDTLYGPLAFDRKGVNTDKPMVISQINLSRFVPVAPSAIAAASINFTRPKLASAN